MTALQAPPLRDGLRHEGEIFQRLMQTRESRDLRYGFLADRAAGSLETSSPPQAPRPIDRIARPGAILATNTSTLDVNLIAAATERPEDVVGLHFFSPAHLMRLLEVVRGSATSDAVLTASMGFARRIGKIGVISRVCDGFIGNRMLEEYCRQAGFLLDEGVLPERVDRALEDWGMAMGPFAVLDLAGAGTSHRRPLRLRAHQ